MADSCVQVSPKHRVPVRAVWLPILVVMVLACLNVASTAAFGAFIALSSMGLFTSYLIAISCMVHARFQKDGVQFGEWNMGKLELPVNLFAIVYTAYVTIWLPFPSSLPVTRTNMNYALPIFAFTTFFALGL
jgi:choline transport protein